MTQIVYHNLSADIYMFFSYAVPVLPAVVLRLLRRPSAAAAARSVRVIRGQVLQHLRNLRFGQQTVAIHIEQLHVAVLVCVLCVVCVCVCM